MSDLTRDLMQAIRRASARCASAPIIAEIKARTPRSGELLRGRSVRQAPDIDGLVYITAGQAEIGAIVPLRITDSSEYDLIGEIVED